MFFKNVIMPFIMALGDGTFPACVNTHTRMLYAIGLDIYEELAVFFTLNIKYRRLKKVLSASNSKPLTFHKSKIQIFSRITIVIFFMVFACILCYPQLLSYFNVGISGDTAKIIALTRSRISMHESVPKIVYYSYIFFVNILRLVLPITIIYKLYLSAALKDNLKIIISLTVVCFSAILTTETIATSIFIAIALTLLISRIYIKQRKKILFTSLGAIGIAGIFALFLKSFGSGGLQSAGYGQISSMFQAYFSGLENIAVASMIPRPFSLNELLGDIFRFVPYIMYFFKGFITSNTNFNYIYFGNPDTATQIIPMISQGARYFSVFFAPVFTLIFCGLAVHWEIKDSNKGTLFDYTLCVIGCICFSMSVVMYSASLGLQLYLNYIAPIQFIIWIVRRITMSEDYSIKLLRKGVT